MDIVIPVLFFIVAMATGVLTLMGFQSRSRILCDWLRLDNAVVLESKVESRGRWFVPVIVYEYESNGTYYVGQDSPWTLLPMTQAWARERVASYQQGDVVTVFVAPDDHQASVLFPSPPARAFVVGVLCALASTCAGGILLWRG